MERMRHFDVTHQSQANAHANHANARQGVGTYLEAPHDCPALEQARISTSDSFAC